MSQRFVIYSVIKYLPAVYAGVLAFVCREWRKAVLMRALPKPTDQAWYEYISDKPNLVRWYRRKWFDVQVNPKMIAVIGHPWEQKLLETLKKVAVLRLIDAYELASFVEEDRGIRLDVADWLVNKFGDVRRSKNFFQIGHMTCNYEQCAYLIYDYIKMIVPGLVEGLKLVKGIIPDYPIGHPLTTHNTLISQQIVDVVTKLELIEAKVNRELSERLLGEVAKRVAAGTCTASHICYTCGKMTMDYMHSVGYVCKKCQSSRGTYKCTELIESHLEVSSVVYIKNLTVDVGISKRFVDYYMPGATRDIILECDEYQHISYGIRNEQYRMKQIVNSERFRNRNVCFVRFNPDSYVNKEGKVMGRGKLERYIHLVKVVEAIMRTKPVRRVEVVYLYYDGWDGQIVSRCMN